jgi:hypothetical protein
METLTMIARAEPLAFYSHERVPRAACKIDHNP